MKTIEEKAKRYDELKVIAQELEEDGCFDKLTLFDLFPELAESEDEKIIKDIVTYLKSAIANKGYRDKIIESWIAWLEKQSKEIMPLEKIIHNVWELGNYWKELTKGFCNTEYGSQLDYIVKHWKEGEHFIKSFEKQDSQIPANSAKTCKNEQKPIKEHNVCDFCEDRYGCVNPCPTKLIEEQKPVDFSDLRTWKYIVDAVWTEKEGIGQYLDSPFTEEVAKKLQKRFGKIEQKPAETEKGVKGNFREIPFLFYEP